MAWHEPNCTIVSPKMQKLPNINKSYGRPCIMAQGMGTQRILFMLGTGVKCNQLLKIYCIFFVLFYLWKLPSTLAPTAYSHSSVTKQWPRNCEVLWSKPCRCAILVPFCGAFILITVIYDLSIVTYTCFSSHAKDTLANYYSIQSENVYYYLDLLFLNYI